MICFGVEPAYFVSEYQRFRLLVPVVPSLTAVISFLQIWKTKLKNSGKVVPPAPELGGVGMVQVAAGEGGAAVGSAVGFGFKFTQAFQDLREYLIKDKGFSELEVTIAGFVTSFLLLPALFF